MYQRARWRYKCESELTQNSTFTIVLILRAQSCELRQDASHAYKCVRDTTNAEYSLFTSVSLFLIFIDIRQISLTNLFCARSLHQEIISLILNFCGIFKVTPVFTPRVAEVGKNKRSEGNLHTIPLLYAFMLILCCDLSFLLLILIKSQWFELICQCSKSAQWCITIYVK